MTGVTGKGDDASRAERDRLEFDMERQASRIQRAVRERRTLAGETVYLGTIGVLFVAPVIGGAYLGRWLDDRLAGYSIHWTLSSILLGVLVGSVNVYLFIRERTRD